MNLDAVSGNTQSSERTILEMDLEKGKKNRERERIETGGEEFETKIRQGRLRKKIRERD